MKIICKPTVSCGKKLEYEFLASYPKPIIELLKTGGLEKKNNVIRKKRHCIQRKIKVRMTAVFINNGRQKTVEQHLQSTENYRHPRILYEAKYFQKRKEGKLRCFQIPKS